MKTPVFLVAVALLAVGITSGVNATPQSCTSSYDLAVLRCYWSLGGDYQVKNFDIYYGGENEGLSNGYPGKGDDCLAAMGGLQNEEWFRINESAGNARSDTYLLRRCSDSLIAILSLDGDDPFVFGPVFVGATADIPFTITNIGTGSASLIQAQSFPSPFQFRDGSYPGTTGTCTDTLAAGLSCTISVEFLAPLTPGFYSSDMVIEYFDGQQTQTIQKTIQGTAFDFN